MTESESKPKRKRKRRWLRFSLRTFLIVVTMLCVWLAWYVYRVERQKNIVAWIETSEGSTLYRFQVDASGIYLETPKARPTILANTIGVDYVSYPVEVHFHEPVIDLSPLVHLPGLEYLWLTPPVSDFRSLAKLRNLKHIFLLHPYGNDEIEKLREALPDVEIEMLRIIVEPR